MNYQLKQLRKTLGLNQTQFGRYLGLTQVGYSSIERQSNPLAERYIKVICSTFNVNEKWLRTGEGEMFFSSPYEKEFTELFSHLVPETQQFLLLMARELVNTQEKLLSAEDEETESPCEDTPSEGKPQ